MLHHSFINFVIIEEVVDVVLRDDAQAIVVAPAAGPTPLPARVGCSNLFCVPGIEQPDNGLGGEFDLLKSS